MPKGSLVNRYRPQGVLNVKSFELSSSTGSCQYPLQASRDMKLLTTDSLLATSSTVTVGWCVLLRTLFKYLGSIKIRTSSFEWSVLFFHFRLSITNIDETQEVLSSSSTIIPSSSISVSFSRVGYDVYLEFSWEDVPLEELTDQLPNVLC